MLNKKILFLIFNLYFFNIICMELAQEDIEQDVVTSVSDTVINIGKTHYKIVLTDQDIQDQKDLKLHSNFVGQKLFEDILPLEIWLEIASFLDFNDPALVYYFGPRLGLTEKQAKKIAATFYENLLKKVKKTRDFEGGLKINEESFCYYRHEPSKALLKKLLAEQNKFFLELNGEYSEIHKKIELSCDKKIAMRISQIQPEIIAFWNNTIRKVVNNYSEKEKLRDLSDEKLFELSLLLLNLNKLYNIYKVPGAHLSIIKKFIISVVSTALFATFLSLGLEIGSHTDLGAALCALGVFIMAFGISWHWLLGVRPCHEIYLAQIKIFSEAVEKEILKRKGVDLTPCSFTTDL